MTDLYGDKGNEGVTVFLNGQKLTPAISSGEFYVSWSNVPYPSRIYTYTCTLNQAANEITGYISNWNSGDWSFTEPTYQAPAPTPDPGNGADGGDAPKPEGILYGTYTITRQDEGTEIRALADDIYRRIHNAGLTPDSTTSNDTFSNVPQGYYMIAETKTGNAQDAYSLVMLGTAGKENAVISTKESVPTVEKKVKEYNDTTATQTDWQDAADYDIGDSVPFQLTGTLPKDLSGYSRYTYIFHDTLSKGLTYNNDAKIYLVTGSEENEVTVNPEMGGAQTFKITPVKNASTGETDISFECLMTKGLAQMPNPEQSKIVIRYTATLRK